MSAWQIWRQRLLRTAAAEPASAAAPIPADGPLLEIDNLQIAYREADGLRTVVHGVSLSVRAGEVVALVGESGSGKSTTSQAAIGLLPDNGLVVGGSIRLLGEDVTHAGEAQWRSLRGRVVSLVPQDPTASLNPVRTIGAQVAEVLQLHGWRDAAAVEQQVVELLRKVGLSRPELRYRQYPHELSGGMKQRVLIAMAVALKPALIIADEPTSALDVTVQRRILDLIDILRRETGTAVLLVTHDLGVAADRAHRIVVLRQGRVQEAGETLQVLRQPQSSYARQLLADAPVLSTPVLRTAEPDDAATVTEWAVQVQEVAHHFPVPGQREPFKAVDGVSFQVRRGSTHAIVGESGSGKTTTIHALVGLLRSTAGQIRIAGEDVTALRGEALRQFRRKVQLVYQNPYASLYPRQTVWSIVEEPLRNFAPLPAAERRQRVQATLERVGLAAELHQRRPHALSGGQRQRVAIARALVLQPEVLVLDEAVSALDVTVQAQILRLLETLQQQLQLTYVFVTHDLSVVRQIAHTVSVLQHGKVVEQGTVEQVFLHPRSHYTRELIAAIPGTRSIDFVQSHHHPEETPGLLQPIAG
ncbi:ABC transporter ATP-binding protein [Comamonas terrigena]|uniref:ABC transporter ATP-binding protein n=1 Tax=Comamonas terrigena TaxID=32013 RepID=UPI00244CB1A3|nr:ABC transporter ATP-binding protein [Comamonas terrigena]MDH1290898.1 ABC transporter ATP-binding protein [Comamonas terrigena]